jgi:glucose-6-phosphate dehydrogenase assembly protein OpcA
MASWSGRGVTIGQVDDALLDLRRGEERAATRVSTINLVVVAEGDVDVRRAREAMRRLGGRNPGRTVILIPDPAGSANVDAEVRLYHATIDARPVWWEEVLIMVSGPACDHLDSVVEPLTLGDLPVTVWYASSIPEAAEPLVGAADAVIVESPAESSNGRSASRTAGEPTAEAFSLLLDVSQRRPVIDLSWLCLTPWRRLVAAIFAVGQLRAFADDVDRAEVAGAPGTAFLLSGWLMDRLELPASSVTRRSADRPAVELSASGPRGAGRFSVASEEEDLVTAVAEIEGVGRRHDAVKLPADPLATGLTAALTLSGHDLIYERAVAAALDAHR